MPFDPSSREAEAQAEIAATRIPGGLAAALGLLFAALLASGPALETVAALRGDSAVLAPLPPAEGGLRSRVPALLSEIESRFDERSALVDGVRPPTQWLLTAGAGYGNEESIVGRDGWLFFRDDFDHLTRRASAARLDPRGAVAHFRDQLATRGLALLVVPVPVKPTVQPGRLAAGAAPAPVRWAGEPELLAQLRSDGVAVLDLADRFARDARLGPQYLATDTHWRPEAVEVAAREIAIRLREIVDLPPGEPERFATRTSERAARGDSWRLLDLPKDDRLFAEERVETKSVEDEATGDPAPVLLLGDSFSAIYSTPALGWGAGAGLPDRLAAQLGLDVDRIVRNSGGALATREAFAAALAREPGRFRGLRVVVWELAAREWSLGRWELVEMPPG